MSKLGISRLRKIARVEDLAEKNMNQSVLNIILQEKGDSATASSVIFRRLMNQNTRYIVELWQLNNGKYGVFSGYYNGEWTPENIDFNGIFEDQPSAELYIQENLQSEAQSKENLMSPDDLNKGLTASKKKDLRKRIN